MTSRDRMLIEWSEEDQVFIVTPPEFPCNRTHGTSYEEAAKHGQEVLDLLIETWKMEGRALPSPQFFESDSVLA